jgi:hypothetical protein
MNTRRLDHALALGLLVVVPIVLAACRSKEQAPAPAAQATPSATTPTTTLPPPPTTVPTPPPIWRAARFGMTKDEVLAAFPAEAQRLPAPTEFGAPHVGTSDVAIPAYELDGTRFRVLFGFEGEALNRIQLSAGKADEGTCGTVEKDLTEKHAPPTQRQNTGTSLRGEEITWSLPDQTIVLACAGMRSLGFQSVTLDYWAPGAGIAKGAASGKEPAAPKEPTAR